MCAESRSLGVLVVHARVCAVCRLSEARHAYATKTTTGLVVEDASGRAGFTLSSIVTLGRTRHSLDDYVAVLFISHLVPASKGSVQDDRTRLTGSCRSRSILSQSRLAG